MSRYFTEIKRSNHVTYKFNFNAYSNRGFIMVNQYLHSDGCQDQEDYKCCSGSCSNNLGSWIIYRGLGRSRQYQNWKIIGLQELDGRVLEKILD